jgi:anti-sigma factor ChrR (cupin superfamily)
MAECCGTIRARLEAWAGGTLDEGQGRQVEAHLAICPGCLEEATALDPAAIFLALRDDPLPDGVWTGFDERLLARIREARPAFDWLSLLRPPRLVSVTAPVALVAVLAAAFLVTRPGML